MERSQTSFVARLLRVLLCGLVPAVLTALLTLYRPELLTRFDYGVYDTILRWAGTDAPSGHVAIVDVDERSLSSVGQWPWRRDVIGRLISGIRDLGATTIAVDVIFAEPDRHAHRADAVERGEQRSSPSAPSDPDTALADVMGQGRVVLGYAFTFGEPASSSPPCVLHPLGLTIVQPRGQGSEPSLFSASGVTCSLPSLAQRAGASGFLNAAPDVDGTLRRVPLLLELNGRIYPGLALAAVAATTGTRDIELQTVNVNAASLILDNRIVAMDGKGNLMLRYRGKKKTFPYTSAADILSGQLPVGAFKDKLVFVGATALGTQDLVTTPLDTLFDGVEVQATVADNLLQLDFIKRPGQALALEMLAVVGLGILVALWIGRAGVAWGSLAVVGSLGLMWGGAAWLLSSTGVFLSPLFPTVGVTAAFAATSFATLTDERWRARRAGEERAVVQRLMVQTLLSLVEVRDTDTGCHSRRMQRYVSVLGEQLSAHPEFRHYLTPERIDQLASLAPLHDIGKVGISDQLLKKPGALTDDELAEMRRHPEYGRDVIATAERRVGVHDDEILALAKDIVYTHHERWDGTGYPQGLRGAQIPIPGRLVALADVYDALISRRVYRPPLVHDQAVDLILEGRGTHFDPAVVDAFIGVAPVLEHMSNEAGA